MTSIQVFSRAVHWDLTVDSVGWPGTDGGCDQFIYSVTFFLTSGFGQWAAAPPLHTQTLLPRGFDRQLKPSPEPRWEESERLIGPVV